MASEKLPVAAAVEAERARRRASCARMAGFAWAALTVMIFSGWFVVTRFGVTRELRIWDIAAATAVIALLPAAASLLAIPFLGETPSPAEGMSIVIIVLGVLLASRPAPARRASTNRV
ncbi:hypothetical protein B0G81_7623 [Paraburkholderia sp. BL6665CI2N2]|uniref:hypothetical protein n=1 Tax=Paraburkholderia sp. BL6665CI2N2 TaxID=1938806 RepID=UPI001066519D|nr:hypothetical protein [Paraburkholderia sp. BL6665CI2N2]TDY27082.1 hypothetical protein B0G81_7623 [Paraburkholderia sp. BL6665CI2N2]